jgi:hypothetical protein
MKLELRRFDLASLADHKGEVVLIGKRNTGMSFLVNDLLLYQPRDQSANKVSGNTVRSQFIHDKYQPTVLENVAKRPIENGGGNSPKTLPSTHDTQFIQDEYQPKVLENVAKRQQTLPSTHDTIMTDDTGHGLEHVAAPDLEPALPILSACR